MRALPSLAVVIIAAAALTSACGQQQAGSGGGGGTAGSQPGGKTAACRQTVPAGHAVMVSASDNGRSFCVRPGTPVTVILRGTPSRKWSPIHASSSALKPHANGRLMLQLGVTGASFIAQHPGTSVISSARPACAQASGGASSPGTGAMHCGALLAFRATVIVHR